MSGLGGLTIAEARDALRAGEIGAVELTEACLAAAEAPGALNAVSALTPELARATRRAAAAARLKAGDAPDLCGIPLGIKDLFCVEGAPAQAASRILEGFRPPYESTVTRKLWEAGAVCIGKLNMDEFAMGSSNETSVYGPAVSPWRRRGDDRGADAGRLVRRLGGGGGGGPLPRGDGTDTGGSIRQPAALHRHRRGEADLRALLALGDRRLRLVARPGRADGASRCATRRSCCGRWPGTTRRIRPPPTCRCRTSRRRSGATCAASASGSRRSTGSTGMPGRDRGAVAARAPDGCATPGRRSSTSRCRTPGTRCPPTT